MSQIPGHPQLPPAPLHTRNPSLGRGRGPVPTLRAEFRGGPSGAVSRSSGTMGFGGPAPRPPGLHSNSPFLPTFARTEPGALGGEGSANLESKDGGNPGLASPVPPTFPRPFRPKLFCIPLFPLHLSLCMPELALAEFAICKLGRRRCCKPRKAAPSQAGGEFAMHASPGGPGPTQAGLAPTPWTLPPGHPRLLT